MGQYAIGPMSSLSDTVSPSHDTHTVLNWKQIRSDIYVKIVILFYYKNNPY